MLGHFIHSRERACWRKETRRRSHPFAWGSELLGGAAGAADPGAFLADYAARAVSASDDFFAAGPAPWYQLRDNWLTFPSALSSPYPENNLATARWFPASGALNGGRAGKSAVVVLPQWNAAADGHWNICRALNLFGLSALRLSLPYHDHRMPAGHERADSMVSPNIGLTLQASRQAVLDARRAGRWLEQQGFERLGILGTSIGSSIGFITAAHEPALRAGVFLHVSTYFADVVRTGMTTSHVWKSLEGRVTPEELRHYWTPISPLPYVRRMQGADKRLLLVSGRYDLSFLPEFSKQLWEELARHNVPHESLVLPCGHYTLGRFPFNYLAAARFLPFLRRALL